MLNWFGLWSLDFCLEEAELLAGVENGPANLVAGAGEVDDGQGHGGGEGGRRELLRRDDEAVRDRCAARC